MKLLLSAHLENCRLHRTSASLGVACMLRLMVIKEININISNSLEDLCLG